MFLFSFFINLTTDFPKSIDLTKVSALVSKHWFSVMHTSTDIFFKFFFAVWVNYIFFDWLNWKLRTLIGAVSFYNENWVHPFLSERLGCTLNLVWILWLWTTSEGFMFLINSRENVKWGSYGLSIFGSEEMKTDKLKAQDGTWNSSLLLNILLFPQRHMDSWATSQVIRCWKVEEIHNQTTFWI